MVRFVDDDHVGGGQRHFVGAHTPRPQGLNARDLGRIREVEVQAGLNKSVIDCHLERRLFEDFAPVRQYQDPLAGLHRTLDDIGKNDSLAAPGRQHVKNFFAVIQRRLNVVDGGLLVGAQLGQGTSPSVQEPSHPYISALANRRSSSTIASLSQPSGDIAVQHVSEDAGHIGRLAVAKAAATGCTSPTASGNPAHSAPRPCPRHR